RRALPADEDERQGPAGDRFLQHELEPASAARDGEVGIVALGIPRREMRTVVGSEGGERFGVVRHRHAQHEPGCHEARQRWDLVAQHVRVIRFPPVVRESIRTWLAADSVPFPLPGAACAVGAGSRSLCAGGLFIYSISMRECCDTAAAYGSRIATNGATTLGMARGRWGRRRRSGAF